MGVEERVPAEPVMLRVEVLVALEVGVCVGVCDGVPVMLGTSAEQPSYLTKPPPATATMVRELTAGGPSTSSLLIDWRCSVAFATR